MPYTEIEKKIEFMRKIWVDWLWGLISNYAKTHSKAEWNETDEKMWNQIQHILQTWTPPIKEED